MIKTIIKTTLSRKSGAAFNETDSTLRKSLYARRAAAGRRDPDQLISLLATTGEGQTQESAQKALALYGPNTITRRGKKGALKKLAEAFVNPFTAILTALALISLFTDVILAAPGEKNPATVIIITAMVLISGLLRMIQEAKSGDAAARLSSMIRTTVCVQRPGQGKREIPLEQVAVGDLVCLTAGDMIPADVRILSAKDLFLNQSALTGESEPVEKDAGENAGALMGSSVVSGTATALVVATGDGTALGGMAKDLAEPTVRTGFEKGVNAVSWLLIRLMLIMAPVVFAVNGLTKGDWLDAGLFAVSVAVGLTPEMLPMIVTTSLASGAMALSREKVIVKKLNAIQDLGAADILCTDKTGTLTEDQAALEYHLDIRGNKDARVLRHAFLNSYYQTGLKNLIDLAVIRRTREESEKEPCLAGLEQCRRKVDEIPFDFERRRMSVVVADETGKTQMITKGAVEEMLAVCSFAECDGLVLPLSEQLKALVRGESGRLNEQGFRVIAVAQKTNPSPVGAFSVRDEADMVLMGYLAFLDPPKDTAAAAILALGEKGVTTKILTGDNEKVAACVCRKVGIPVKRVLLGPEISVMTDEKLAEMAERTAVFARLSPAEKARVIRVLRDEGHTVAFLGDGINDAAAMRAADVGISVDTAADIAREAADVILLEKDLTVLEKGITEGRKTYANMMKYIRITASSNFGNMFSVLAASAFLPFLPMAAIHLVLLNLIYDVSCTAMPWDNVDDELLETPRKWDVSPLTGFMGRFGPISSLFDIATYLVMYFIICPSLCGGLLYHQIGDPALQTAYAAVFQAGWFVESMWSQTLVVHMLRTEKLPLLQSRASLSLTLFTGAGIALATLIPFSPIGVRIGLAPLPAAYFPWLIVILAGYILLTTAAKLRWKY